MRSIGVVVFLGASLIQHLLKYPLSTAADLSIVFPLLLSLRYSGHSAALRWFVVYIVWSAARNGISIWTASRRINNLPLFNADLLIRTLLLLTVFRYTFQHANEKQAIRIIAVLFILLFGVDFVLSNPNLNDWYNHRLNRYSFAVESVLMLGLVLRFFLYLVRELPVANLLKYPMFWICCGLLVAHAGTVFLTPFLHYINVWNNPYNFRAMVRIEHWVEIMRNVAFAIAMAYARRSTR